MNSKSTRFLTKLTVEKTNKLWVVGSVCTNRANWSWFCNMDSPILLGSKQMEIQGPTRRDIFLVRSHQIGPSVLWLLDFSWPKVLDFSTLIMGEGKWKVRSERKWNFTALKHLKANLVDWNFKAIDWPITWTICRKCNSLDWNMESVEWRMGYARFIIIWFDHTGIANRLTILCNSRNFEDSRFWNTVMMP